MSFISELLTNLKQTVIVGYLKQALSWENLKQPSTWKGLIRLAVAAGLFTISPEAQDTLVETVMKLIATGEIVKGTIDVIRNEKKQPKPLPWLEPK